MNTSIYPSEPLRKKLLIAGIPESEHSAEALATKIPASSNAASLQAMSADMIAELLLYFISKSILTLPVASDKALLDMPWGSHVCQYYTRKEDLLIMLVPFFKQGLERNEACVWLVGDLTVAEAREGLEAVVPDLQAYLDSGQMQIRDCTEFYADSNGRVRSPDLLSAEFETLGMTTRAKGFAGLRASGNVSWIHDEENMLRLKEYETKVNYAIQTSRIMAVCTYPVRSAAMCDCNELMHNHGKFFVKRGEWTYDISRDAEKIEAVFSSLAGT